MAVKIKLQETDVGFAADLWSVVLMKWDTYSDLSIQGIYLAMHIGLCIINVQMGSSTDLFY